jgi:hypothetical protein
LELASHSYKQGFCPIVGLFPSAPLECRYINSAGQTFPVMAKTQVKILYDLYKSDCLTMVLLQAENVILPRILWFRVQIRARLTDRFWLKKFRSWFVQVRFDSGDKSVTAGILHDVF